MEHFEFVIQKKFEVILKIIKKAWKLAWNTHRNPGILSIPKNENPVCITSYGMKVV